MDTIDRVTLDRAAQHVTRINLKGVEIHTVLIVLNGQHGGAESIDDEITIEAEA